MKNNFGGFVVAIFIEFSQDNGYEMRTRVCFPIATPPCTKYSVYALECRYVYTFHSLARLADAHTQHTHTHMTIKNSCIIEKTEKIEEENFT